jgi:two-component system OmpR family sensor kinase
LNSIRSRLLIWQISALLLAALIAGALTFVLARRGFDQVRDYGLQQIAHSVLRHDVTAMPGQIETESTSRPTSLYSETSTTVPLTSGTEEVDADPDEGQFVSQIWSPSGELVFSSLDDDGPTLQHAGFHQTQWQEQTWRTYTAKGNGRVVQVAVSIQDRDSAFYELLPGVLVPMVLLVVMLALMIHEAVKHALRPLDSLRHQINQRAVSELHALDTTDLPVEVAPLARTLNQLLTQLDQLLVSQRQFLADAAHELNTPLAAIKLQAQLARRAPSAEREASLNELDAGIERAIHLAAQLLALARLEPDERTPQHSEVNWHEIVREVVISLSPLAEARRADLGLLRCEPAVVMANDHELRAMLNNLIDNALRYSPPGAKVDVDLVTHGGQATLTVSDNGPGIPKDQRERVLQRFVRLHPGDTTGSGLGLSIVKGIVDACGGELQLKDSPEGGMTACITLPLIKPSPG